MPVKTNMIKLLRWLFRKDNAKPELWYNGPAIQEKLKIRTPELNDAVELLTDEDFITRMNWMGTAPYIFGQIRINARGKNFLETRDFDEASRKLLFFSYSTKDKESVGLICAALEDEYNFKVFRAHDNIKITDDWRERIKENLNNCDGLIAYISRSFRGSEWTYQECGWIAARGKPIFSLFIMKKIPGGFIEEKQGMRITEEMDHYSVAQRINDVFT